MSNAISPRVEAPGAGKDLGFALAITLILAIFFLPVPAILIDLGLAFSIAFSVVILMVALWIQKPLEFSAFPTVLLVATILRLGLNIATTRLILSNGSEGVTAAGFIIGGFSRLVMGGDFVIGLIVFSILVTVNFLVITKGATRIAEVGARFTLDAIPGKQMAIDADLSAGLIDDKEAQRRRRELEEESSFFGSLDGASKFVRGDAIAGLIILAVNVLGGIIIGVTRHKMSLGAAADVYTKLSVGDGLVSQIPALIVSLAAGLLVSKGGTKGSAEAAVLSQLGLYPRALMSAAALLGVLGLIPGLPLWPFASLSALLALIAYTIPRKKAEALARDVQDAQYAENAKPRDAQESVRDELKNHRVELVMGKQLAAKLSNALPELAQRSGRMRLKFARQYGLIVPEIRVSDSLDVAAKGYEIRVHGTTVAQAVLKVGDLLVVLGDRKSVDLPGEETREPAFGMQALWVPEASASELRRRGLEGVDNLSVMLTHLSEVIRSHLAQLLSYRDMRMLMERLEPEYRKLLEETCPAHLSYSGMQSVLKLLLAERVSIRNLDLVLEAVAEIAPHARRAEQICEHVRIRLASQICGDLSQNGVLNVLRLGSRWDLAFQQAIRRDAKGEVTEFDMEPALVERFSEEAAPVIRQNMDSGYEFVLLTTPDARTFVRMIIERSFATLPVLSHLEIARGVQIKALGTIS